MAQASVGSTMSDYAESSASAIFSRNDDDLTIALRSNGPLEIDDLIRLNRHASPSHDPHSSVGTRTTDVFSSRQPSSGTKPTSAGTSYPTGGCNSKGKAVVTSASSVSASHGSGSEAEAEQDAALAGIGYWAGSATSQPLKGVARGRKRARQRSKRKKPQVVLVYPSSADDESPVPKPISRRHSKEDVRRRPVNTRSEKDRLEEDRGEERRASLVIAGAGATACRAPLSRARLCVLRCLLAAMCITFALAVFAAYYTGKGRIACTKGIIFSATVVLSILTVLAMIVARQALQTALLAALLEFIFGFALVVQIHDFLWHA